MDPNKTAEIIQGTETLGLENVWVNRDKLIDALADYFEAEQRELSRIGNYVIARAFDRAQFLSIAKGSAGE